MSGRGRRYARWNCTNYRLLQLSALRKHSCGCGGECQGERSAAYRAFMSDLVMTWESSHLQAAIVNPHFGRLRHLLGLSQ